MNISCVVGPEGLVKAKFPGGAAAGLPRKVSAVGRRRPDSAPALATRSWGRGWHRANWFGAVGTLGASLWLAVAASSPALAGPNVSIGLSKTGDGSLPGGLPANVRRVVFLGDSITYAGQYVTDVAAYEHARWPGRPLEFINIGLPSETVSGLSEPGHAGGKFPRPDLHERLARALARTKPDLVIACYGMNDGIYLPFDEGRFKAFQDGINWLHAQVERSGAKIIHVTPPVIDEAKGGHPGYAAVLDHYADWLIARRTNGWDVADLHFPMKEFLAARRLTNAAFAYGQDGIHPGELGHWVMAQQILLHLGAKEAARAGSIGELLANFPNGNVILQRDQKDQAVWKDAWLTAIGHQRPGMNRGAPIAIDPQTGAARFVSGTNSTGAAKP